MILDINKCFPVSPVDGSQGPLPKQRLFLQNATDPNGPHYIRYCGGIGSGKTMIGAITMLTWAVLYPGDYLVCRQFLPELKITSYKQFKEVCPPELIQEERIADGIIRIKAVGGGVSNIIFRGLEEPDKHRSLNLSGFWIDEANQVTEAAFQLLQGRLRGKGLRKGILTTNTAGRDWAWRWFINKDHFKPTAKRTIEQVRADYVNIYAPSTENHHLPEDYVESKLATWSEERIRREIYADEDSFEGMIFTEFRQDVHVVRPFALPKEWTRFAGVDHGYTNPSAWIWGAMDFDGNLYIYREFYRAEWTIEEICKGKVEKGQHLPGILELQKGERLEWAKLDPSTRARRNERDGRKISDFDIYQENLPDDFPLMLANNEVNAGIDRVKTWLKPNARTNEPKLFIFNTCTNLIDEMANYRWQSLTAGQEGTRNQKEAPRKYKDHAVDALRYLVMGLPEAPDAEENIYEKIPYNSSQGRMYRDIQALKNKGRSGGDPWGM